MNIWNKINPLVKKDIRTSSRNIKLCLGVFIFETLLSLIWLLASITISSISRFPRLSDLNDYLYFFPVFAVSETCIIAIIMPILTSSAISGEKERQTFDLMLTTPLSTFRIAMGKIISAFIKIMLYIIGSLPIIAIPFITGSLPWYLLFIFLLCLMIFAFFAGSLGLFCSSISTNTISALIRTFLFYVLFFGGSFIPMLIDNLSRGHKKLFPLLFLLFNPGVIIEEDLVLSLNTTSVFGARSGDISLIADQYFYDYNTNINYYPNCFLFKGPTFAILSAIIIILSSLFFIKLTSININPKYAKMKKRKKKNKAPVNE